MKVTVEQRPGGAEEVRLLSFGCFCAYLKTLPGDTEVF